MYFYLLTSLCIAGFGYLYKEKIIKNYRDFRELNKFLETRHKGIGKILYVSIEIVCKKFWFEFLQKINNSIERIDKNTSVLTYNLDGRLYKIVLDHRKGPALVLLVTDENSEDVTTLVVPFIGPKRDWHKREFTPKFWGKKRLYFELSTGENKTFSEEDIIKLI
jgi:hypothetical protein